MTTQATTKSEYPMIHTRAKVPEGWMLPPDHSRVETRIPIDYLDIGSLIQAMMAAFMLDRSWPATELINECGDLWDIAANSCFDEASEEDQAAVFRLLARLFNELDFSNYRIELVREKQRHR